MADRTITQIGSATGVYAASTGITFPSFEGIVNGDFMVVALRSRGDTEPTGYAPAGWSSVASLAQTNVKYQLFYKKADGEPTTGYNFYHNTNTNPTILCIGVAKRNCSSSNPHSYSNTAYQTNDNILKAAGVTASATSTLSILLGFTWSSTGVGSTSPSGTYSEVLEYIPRSDYLGYICEKSFSSSGDTGPAAAVLGSVTPYKHAFLINLAPAPTISQYHNYYFRRRS
jgi:hypothetical protein